MSDLAERGAVFAVHDRFPVTAGHLLILPQRHTPDWFSMTARERSDAAPKTGTDLFNHH